LKTRFDRLKASLGHLGDLRTLLAFVGVLIYGAFRLCYDAFYGELGVTPEEVGISPTAILLRAIIGIVYLSGVAATVLAALLVMAASWSFSRDMAIATATKPEAPKVVAMSLWAVKLSSWVLVVFVFLTSNFSVIFGIWQTISIPSMRVQGDSSSVRL
jgi:hypothetical protein